MKAQDIMTGNPACCGPEDSVADAARMMRDTDCGCLPVVDPRERRTIGVVTDRDLVVRAVAGDRDHSTRIGDVMTRDPAVASPDDDLEKVERLMAERQVRRVPVVDRSGMCVGIIAQADVALALGGDDDSALDVARVVQRISEPSGRSGGRARGRTAIETQ
jgi:CBS domain-containing protein